MKVKTADVKVSISTATKGMRESLDKAETNIANLIKENQKILHIIENHNDILKQVKAKHN